MEMLEVAFATCKGSGWHVYKFDLRENFYESLPAVLFCNGVRKFIKLCSEPCDSTPANASKGWSFTARGGCLKECDLAKDRSFDMSSVEGAEPLDPKAGLEKLLRELGDVTCDYSINPPPWRNFHSLTWVCTAWFFWIPPVVQFSEPDLTDSVRSLVLHSLDYFGMGHCHHDCTNWKKKGANMGKHIRYLWGVVECPWCWEASSASLKRNWLKCCKSPGAKVPDGKCQKRRSQQTTPLSSPQTLQETNFDRLPFYPRNRISRSAQQGGNMQCSRSTTKWIIKIYQGLIFQLEKKVWYVPKHHWTLGPRFGGNHDENGVPPALNPSQAYHLDRFRGKKSMPDCCRHGMEIRV